MSSYNQVNDTRTLAEMLGLATAEIMKLHDEMSDLCATIAAQFPDTHEHIGKYQQAFRAIKILGDACGTLEEPLERIDPPARRRTVTVMVGKQTRSNRASSQRVRLGNAIVRLRGVVASLTNANEAELQNDLTENITALETVVFPKTYG